MKTFWTKSRSRNYVIRKAAYALILQNWKVAIIETPWWYYLPWWWIEWEENSKECLIRELKEELWWKVKVGELFWKAKQYFYSENEYTYFEWRADFFLITKEWSYNGSWEEDHILRWIQPEMIIGQMYHEYQSWWIEYGLKILTKNSK